MQRNAIVFGLISGLIISTFMAASMYYCYTSGSFEGSMLVGYASMLVAFSFIFVGVKNFRDKFNDGFISFGKAFQLGFFIALIASTMYVLMWTLEYNLVMPDFMDKYSAMTLEKAREAGATAAELEEKMAEIQMGKDLYKNPLSMILITYAEILPVGLLVALAAALVFKKKSPDGKKK